ncbi:MAG: hypothetical protein IT204_11160 [Fimbriimonadaceae bacterium]|nr:hypothetical protein [Fimbriimonadaceae bacterium]
MVRPLPILLAALLAWPLPAADNPVSNGGFETVDAQGRPVDWELLGSARLVSAPVHSGARALHLVRTSQTTGEVGLNRTWQPGSLSQGRMLGQRQGALRFWYRAGRCSEPGGLQLQVIPMNTRPLETGGRTVWHVPQAHHGDGRWHAGVVAYNYTSNDQVAWVHVGARLHGAVAELWLDDLSWSATAGPVLHAESFTWRELDATASRGEARLTVRNQGDAKNALGQVVLSLPPGLTTPQTRLPLPVLAPGKAATIVWAVSGRRDGPRYPLRATVTAGEQLTDAALELRAELSEPQLRTPAMLVTPGRAVDLSLVARNSGQTLARLPLDGARLTLPPGLRLAAQQPSLPAATLAPGRSGVVRQWSIVCGGPTSYAPVRVSVPGQPDLVSPLVAPPRRPTGIAGEGEVYAAVEGDEAVIGTRRVRLILARGPAGFGFGELQVPGGGGWQTVALLPRLGLLATAAGEGPLVCAQAAVELGDEPGLVLSGTRPVGGVEAQVRLALSVRGGDDSIGYELTVSSPQTIQLAALEGPQLYAGDGGGQRQDGLLPGLEWLVPGEDSSNDLDITPDHPDRRRDVPHPLKVTVPAAGFRVGGTAVGLLWDPPAQQPAAAQVGPAGLVFSTPNRLEGHANHLVGLQLPAPGAALRENTRRAHTPLTIAPLTPLTIRALLTAVAQAPDALALLDRWYQRYGVPTPQPLPRGSWPAEIAFSLQAYRTDRALWNAEWKRWYSDLIVGFRATDSPVDELLLGGAVVGGETQTTAQALAAQALDAAALAQRQSWQPEPAEILQVRRAARIVAAQQEPDGTWRFGGEKAWPAKLVGLDRAKLGPVGASEVGLTAIPANQVLQAALLTGDAELRDSGLAALEAMRRFQVPRAAQVWEVPVHTPDIYASAVATQAYLRGYELTGQQRWLQEAVKWARSGLPFVYAWAPADQPVVQGATIPVFGATSYVLSWFAVAVQWNGLAYGDALWQLGAYDQSFPWRQVADNILVSGLYQQAVEGDRAGPWPDALNFIPGRPGLHGQTPPCFTPSTLVYQALERLGQVVRPTVRLVRRGGDSVALRGKLRVLETAWTDQELRAVVELPPHQPGALQLVGLAAPAAVLVDGQELPATGWHHAAASSSLSLTLPVGRHTVVLRGAQAQPLPATLPVRRAIDFRFDHDLDGWEALHDLTPLQIADSALQTSGTGGDPYLGRNDLAVEGAAADTLVLRLSLSGGSPACSLFWSTVAAPGFQPSRELHFEVPTDGQPHEVRLPVGQQAAWAGQTISGLRIDPGSGVGTVARLSFVRLERGK